MSIKASGEDPSEPSLFEYCVTGLCQPGTGWFGPLVDNHAATGTDKMTWIIAVD